MLWSAHSPGVIVGMVALWLSTAYGVLVLAAVLCWRSRSAIAERHGWRPGVTILKPLCGAEPGLYENLRSFCAQDYARFQVLFGVRDSADPALAIVQRLQREFPDADIGCVVNPRQHGSNRKVSNLINMLAEARHPVIAIVDSDARVGSDYLARIVAPLADARVGLVTCTYLSVPARGLLCGLGAMYVNEWYMPSVMLAWVFGHRGYASGQTLCLRRDTLNAIGGLHPIVNHLADDYQLAEQVRLQGQRIVLSSYVPRLEQYDASMRDLIAHELRWMRTIRALRPGSFPFLFISFTMPLALLGAALAPGLPLMHALLSAAAASRISLYLLPRLTGKELRFADFWLMPVRDLLLCWVWLRAFFSSRVSWRGANFDVDERGIMRSSP